MSELKLAIQQKNRPKIDEFLSSPNVKQLINAPDKDMQTSLFHAGLHEDEDFGLETVEKLIAAGVDVFHKQDNQQTVVYWLAANNKPKVLSRILQFGFNLNENDAHGQTPIFFAASNGRLKCAEMLLKNGANINHLDGNGQTCLFWAAKFGHLEMCKQLINRGCDPLIVDKLKRVAPFYAKGHPHVVEYLNSFKKEKRQAKLMSQNSDSQSQMVSKKMPKKKQLPKQQYVMEYMDEEGNVKCLGKEEVEEFLKEHKNIESLLESYNREELENLDVTKESQFHKTATKVINGLLRRHDTSAFHEPVAYEQLGLLDYPEYVTEPMDYSTIKLKLQHNCYRTEEQFGKDIKLCYNNCVKYNGEESPYGLAAKKLSHEYDTVLKKEFLG